MRNFCFKKFDTDIVFLSAGIAFLGAYLTVNLIEQLRACYLDHGLTNIWARLKWFLLLGIGLGGIGVWTMHFMSLSALRLRDTVTGEEIDIEYNTGVMTVCMLIIVITTSVGAYVSSLDSLFAKSKSEILEDFLEHSAKLSMKEVKKLKDWIIIRIMCTKDLRYLICGGMIAGGGISITHYIGMTAVIFPGVVQWHSGIIAASVITAILAATLSFWILFRCLSIFPGKESLRFVAAFIMMLAVVGVHYIGIAAMEFYYTGEIPTPFFQAHLANRTTMQFPLSNTMSLVSWLIAAALFADLRYVVYKYRIIIRKQKGERVNSTSQYSAGTGVGSVPGNGIGIGNTGVSTRYHYLGTNSRNNSLANYQPSLSISREVIRTDSIGGDVDMDGLEEGSGSGGGSPSHSRTSAGIGKTLKIHIKPMLAHTSTSYHSATVMPSPTPSSVATTLILPTMSQDSLSSQLTTSQVITDTNSIRTTATTLLRKSIEFPFSSALLSNTSHHTQSQLEEGNTLNLDAQQRPIVTLLPTISPKHYSLGHNHNHNQHHSQPSQMTNTIGNVQYIIPSHNNHSIKKTFPSTMEDTENE